MNYNYTITLNNRYSSKANHFENNAIYGFMRILRAEIAFKTTLCYAIPDPNKDCSITIPIDVLANDQIQDTKKLINSKVKTLKHFLEHELNYEGLRQGFKAVLAGVLCYDFDFSKMLYISNSVNDKHVDVNMKKPTLEKLALTRKTVDNVDVLEVYMPYMDEALICLDITRPYDEMGFSYNALHLFEHLLCTPWSTLRRKSLMANLNGFTSNLGNCFVYAAMSDQKTFKLYVDKLCEWLRDSKKKSFWDEHQDAIKRETNRTISETKQAPSYISFARSPGTAYDYGYNTDIFHYWSNQPMKLTILHPFKGFRYDYKFGKAETVKKPTIEKFNYMPLASNSFRAVTNKVNPKDVARYTMDFYEGKPVADGMFGYDVRYREINKENNKFFEGNDALFVTVPMFLLSTFRDYLKPESLKKLMIDLNLHISDVDSYLFEIYGSNNLFNNRMNEFMNFYEFKHLEE